MANCVFLKRRNRFTTFSGLVVAHLVAFTASADVNLTGWSEYDPDGRWSVSNPIPTAALFSETTSSGTVSPGFFVSDFSLPADASFTLTLEIQSSSDDDLVGFAFNWQDGDNFYLVDWKRFSQSYDWGDAVAVNDDFSEQGLKLKKVQGGYTRDGLWGGADGTGVTTIAEHLDVAWSFNTTYTFDVSLNSGTIEITLDGQPLFSVYDPTFQGGKIAFYGFSQDDLYFTVPETSLNPSLIATVITRVPDGFLIRWPSELGKQYSVQAANGLGGWTTATSTPILGTGASLSWLDEVDFESAWSPNFYRVLVEDAVP